MDTLNSSPLAHNVRFSILWFRAPVIAQMFDSECHQWGIEHERIPVHSANANASMEFWHASRERECLNRQEFDPTKMLIAR